MAKANGSDIKTQVTAMIASVEIIRSEPRRTDLQPQPNPN